MRWQIVCVAMLAGVSWTSRAAADDGYVTIEGTKQGKLKGEGLVPKYADKTQVLSAELGFSQSVTPPVARAGLPTVAAPSRIHEPLTMTFRIAPNTPQLFQAAVTNETLKSVLYEIIGKTVEGEQEVTNTIRLTNARIASIRLFDRNGPEVGLEHLVTVAFAYQKIEIENKQAKVMAAENWLP